MYMEQKEFEIEVGRIRPRLHNEAMRYVSDAADAEDIAQEVVLKLWVMHDRLEEYRSTEALAVVMARRLSLNKMRKATVPLAEARPADTATDQTPEASLIEQEDEERVARLIDALPDTQQAVLRMKHTEGMEVGEIARLTGSSPEAVRQNLSRARRNILKHFVNE